MTEMNLFDSNNKSPPIYSCTYIYRVMIDNLCHYDSLYSSMLIVSHYILYVDGMGD